MCEEPNCIRVRLVAACPTRLGLCLGERVESPRVVITDLASGGVVEKSGLVHKGDSLLKINDIHVTHMTHDMVQKQFQSLPDNCTITLVLKGPENCTTYLQTVFTKDGQPKTARVTTPLCFVNKLRGRHSLLGSTLNLPVTVTQAKLNGQIERAPKTPIKSAQTQTSPTETDQAGLNSPTIVLTDSHGMPNCRNFPKVILTESGGKQNNILNKSEVKINQSSQKQGIDEVNGKQVNIGIEQNGDELTVALHKNATPENGSENQIHIEHYNFGRRKASLTEDGTVCSGELVREISHVSRRLNRRKSTSGSHKSRSASLSPSGSIIRRRSCGLSDNDSPITTPRKHHKIQFLLNQTASTDILYTKSIRDVSRNINHIYNNNQYMFMEHAPFCQSCFVLYSFNCFGVLLL